RETQPPGCDLPFAFGGCGTSYPPGRAPRHEGRSARVEPFEVVAYHAIRREPFRARADARLHDCDPPRAIRIRRQHLALERAVERLGVRVVLILRRRAAIADRPAVDAVLTRLGPPAVEDREVGHAVHAGLHARGPAGF